MRLIDFGFNNFIYADHEEEYPPVIILYYLRDMSNLHYESVITLFNVPNYNVHLDILTALNGNFYEIN